MIPENKCHLPNDSRKVKHLRHDVRQVGKAKYNDRFHDFHGAGELCNER